MFPHHATTIANVVAHFANREEVLAVLLTGSIAHGYARASSDVDIAIIVSASEFQRRQRTRELTFYDAELSAYPEGYVDGKYMDIGFIRDVAQRGSEPARFAFKDARILSSKVDGVAQLISEASEYPLAQQATNLRRFQAQFEAWYWYVQEAFKTQDMYLLRFAASKLALFGARQILAHNGMLFPFHKWLTKELAQAPRQPAHFLRQLEAVLQSPTPETTGAFYASVSEFVPRVESDDHWSIQFMLDSELNWASGHTPIDDL